MIFKLKKHTLFNSLLIFILAMNILGSFFYVGSRSYSVGFLMLPLLLLYNLYYLYKSFKFKCDQEILILFLFLFLFLFCALIGSFFLKTDDNLRVLKFVISLIIISLTIAILYKEDKKRVVKLTIMFSEIVIFIVLILQYLFIYTGLGVSYSKENSIIPASVFNNPNDLSIISLSFFVFYTYCCRGKLLVFKLIAVMLVFASASRFAIVAMAIIILLNIKIKKPKFKNIVFIGSLIFIVFSFNINDILEFFQYSFTRILSITEHFSLNGSTNRESSSYLRINSLLFFLENIHQLGLGSFLFKDYNVFFKDSEFYNSIISTNPHNFFVEISILYGYIGSFMAFLFIVFIIKATYSSVRKNKGIISVFLLAFFCITSSVINFLPIWVATFAILLHNKRLN